MIIDSSHFNKREGLNFSPYLFIHKCLGISTVKEIVTYMANQLTCWLTIYLPAILKIVLRIFILN